MPLRPRHSYPAARHRGLPMSELSPTQEFPPPPRPGVRPGPVPTESRGGPITYLVCDDKPTLLYLANLGCIELPEPRLVRAQRPPCPS